MALARNDDIVIAYITQIMRVIDRRSLLALLVSSLTITVMEVLSVSAVIPAIGVILGDRLPHPVLMALGRAGIDSAVTQKIAVLALITCIFLARGALLSAIVFAQARIVFHVQNRLSERLYRHYLCARFEQIDDIASAHLLRVSTTELGNITHGVILPTATFVSEIALVTGSIIVLLFLQPVIAALLIAAAVLLSAPIFRLNRTRLTRFGQSRHDMEMERFQFAQEIISGAREIKVYGLEPQLGVSIGATNKVYARVLTRITFLQAFPRMYLETMGMCVLLLVCGLLILRGSSTSQTLTFMMIFGLATFRALPSLAKILAQLQSLKFYRPSLTALLGLLDKFKTEPEATMRHDCAPQTAARRERGRKEILVTMADATYKYGSSVGPVFSGFNLAIQSGEKSSGQHVRPRIAYVPQAPVILDASVWRNITLSPVEPTHIPANDSRLREALEISGFDKLMDSRQLSLSSRIVEGGRNMSGGQRQRLALARALYREADILVLDEATSALDRDAENEIFATIKARRANQLILLVTHRPELLAHCCKIIQIAPAVISVSMTAVV
jgi:ABC-type multidrug transport system fused ATPase/permease subunit